MLADFVELEIPDHETKCCCIFPITDIPITRDCFTMKTISLEVDEQIYSQVLGFLRLLPEDRCHVLDDDDRPSREELLAVQAAQACREQGGDTEFVDWDEIKGKL